MDRFLKATIGHNAHAKRVPYELFKSRPKIAKAFIEGYLDGDGYKRDGHNEPSSVCKGLILQIQLLASGLGVFTPASGPTPDDRFRLYVIYEAGRSKHWLSDDNFIYIPLIGKDISSYEGNVYNFETKSSTYLLNNVVTHNSPRRYLDTTLVKLFGEMAAHIFLRWKLSSSSLMVERYFKEDPLVTDKTVLERHPVVLLWR